MPVPYTARFQHHPLSRLRRYALVVPSGPVGFDVILHNNAAYVGGPIGPGGVAPPHVVGALHGHNIDGLRSNDWSAQGPTGNGVYQVTLTRYRRTPQPAPPGLVAYTHRYSLVLGFGGAGALNAYFLPWDARGGEVHMTLGAHANYFFTAGLSGCSVFVVGPAAAPTVYHMGCDQWGNSPYTTRYGNVAPAPNLSYQLWEDLFHNRAGVAPPATRIDKRHYVNDSNPNGTERSRGFQPILRHTKHDNQATVIPFGAVFGLRDPGAGTWSFYHCENAVLEYRQMHHIIFGLYAAGNHVVWKRRSRPLLVRDLYPNAPGAHNAPAGAPPRHVAAIGGGAGQYYGRRWHL